MALLKGRTEAGGDVYVARFEDRRGVRFVQETKLSDQMGDER